MLITKNKNMTIVFQSEAQIKAFAREIIRAHEAERMKPGRMDGEEWLTTRQVCERFSMNRTTLERAAKRGEVERMRVGGTWRYAASSIEVTQ